MNYRLLSISFVLIFNLLGICKANSNDTTNNFDFDISITSDNKELHEIGEALILIPNAFTPYALEQRNGTFRVVYNQEFSSWVWSIANFEMFVYNRRGALVYQTNDITTGWNGKYKGKICQKGGYVYVIRYSINHNIDGVITITSHERKGNVFLCE